MPIPIPMAIDLVFSNMAPNENPHTLNEMKKNYKKSDKITADIQTGRISRVRQYGTI